ncbi:MAG TPA: RNA polymerase sigma factor [Acidimicrobiia bacterium]
MPEPEATGRAAGIPPRGEPGAERPRGAAESGKDGGERELALAAAGGDRDALEQLLDGHVDRVHAVCRRIVGDPEDALDATQEALLAIARGIGRFDGRAAFSTWAYRVATNAALDELRRRKRRPLTAVDDTLDPPVAGGEDGVDVRLDVDAALEQVAEEFRVAVVLRDLADLGYAEIATVLDVPVGTVKSRVARGRAALRDALGYTETGNPSGVATRPMDGP